MFYRMIQIGLTQVHQKIQQKSTKSVHILQFPQETPDNISGNYSCIWVVFIFRSCGRPYTHFLTDIKSESTTWTKICNVQCESKHRNPAFNGNSCENLWHKVNKLRALCNLRCLKYVLVFHDFKTVCSQSMFWEYCESKLQKL